MITWLSFCSAKSGKSFQSVTKRGKFLAEKFRVFSLEYVPRILRRCELYDQLEASIFQTIKLITKYKLLRNEGTKVLISTSLLIPSFLIKTSSLFSCRFIFQFYGTRRNFLAVVFHLSKSVLAATRQYDKHYSNYKRNTLSGHFSSAVFANCYKHGTKRSRQMLHTWRYAKWNETVRGRTRRWNTRNEPASGQVAR